MAAFYPLPRYHFYMIGGFRSGRFNIVFMRPSVLCEVKKIVHRVSEILFAAEIPLGRLHRRMPQQELNLLQFTTTVVTQLRACSPQVVRRDVLQARPRAARLYHVPDNILRDATAPDLSFPGNCSEDFALRDIRSACPVVESGFDPARNRHGANVTTLPNEINHGPVPPPHLDLITLQA